MAWWYSAMRAKRMASCVRMQYVLEEVWEISHEAEPSADFRAIWKEHVILLNGQVCRMKYMVDEKEKMIMPMISMHAPIHSIICPAVQCSTPKKRDWEYRWK